MEDKTEASLNGITIKMPAVQNGHHRPSQRPPLMPEYWKTLWSFAYMNLIVFIMCYATVITHREAPDRKVHPPLPDRIFDNMPYLEWGTKGSEVCIIVQGISCLVLCIFHKHRTIIFRRFCVILATVYMMRIITMLSTALPVLPPPSECTKELTDTVYQRLSLSVSLWLKSGSRLSGMKMCGDYMFSGHITSLTVGTLTFLEYIPTKVYVLRYLSFVINIVASYLLIVGRGHYTVDVIIAIILVFVVFHYYHSLANIYVLTGSSEKLRWFPFFWYFERNVCRAVPNEYEIPRLSNFFGEK